MFFKITLVFLSLIMIISCDDKTTNNNKINNCQKEYNLYTNTHKYKIRIEDEIKKHGCEVIPIYSAIIQFEKFEIFDKLENSPQIMKKIKKLFSINENLSTLLFSNLTISNIIINNSLDEKFLDNFSYLIDEKLYTNDLKKIQKDPHYLNYFLLASLYTKNKTETKTLYRSIKSSISQELLASFTLITSSIGSEYSFSNLLQNFKFLQKKMATEAIKNLSQYPEYFVYFLYPDKSTLNIKITSPEKLRDIQKNVQKQVLYIYSEIFKKYRYTKNLDHISYALLSIENIYPYLLQNPTVNYNEFKNLFSKLVSNGYLVSLFQDNLCSNSIEERFAVFGEDNINKAIQLLKNENNFSHQLFYQFKDAHYSIMSFFYVANAYENLTSKEWKIFKDLLTTLPYEYDNKIVFLQKLEQSGYFRNIIQKDDYQEYINSEYGESNPKYKYILLTPYPTQTNLTLYDTVLSTNIKKKTLQKILNNLIDYNKYQLEVHEFTNMEQLIGSLDKLDTFLTVSAIVLVPFTHGISLTYVAKNLSAKQTTKSITKRSVNHLKKQIILKSKIIMNKSIKKINNIHTSLNKKLGKENIKIFNGRLNKIDNAVTILSISANAPLLFYSNDMPLKQICEGK